jgi:putative ABC transport system permease protein
LTSRFAVGRVLRRPAPARPWISAADFDESGVWRRGWLRDLRYAWRSVFRQPALAAVVVSTLALALAANATVFSIMDAIVLRPYRFEGIDRIVMVASDSPTAPVWDRESVATFDFREWQRHVKTVAVLGAAEWWNANLSEVDTPEQLPAFKVTASYFEVLQAKPRLGRLFTADSETLGQHRRVVIGHTLWQRRFAGDPAIIGKTIRLDGEPHEVVAVTEPGFDIPFGAEAWAPMAYDPAGWANRKPGSLQVIGRLAEGATVETARAELTSLVAHQREQYPDTHATREVLVTSFTVGMGDPGGVFVAMSQAAAALLLLVACANIANLLLARGAERGQEFGVRLALGAGRGRLAGQLLIEGGILATLAVTASLPLSWIGLEMSRGGIPPGVLRFVPGWRYLGVDLAVLAVTAALAIAATLLFSLLPAVHAWRSGADALRHSGRVTGSRQRHHARNALASAQVALSLALLFGSGLMLSAADRAVNGALGFDKSRLMTAQLVLPERPHANAELRRQFVAQVVERMQANPAAEVVAVTNSLPYSQTNPSDQIFPEGQMLDPQEALDADVRRVSPPFFSVLRIPLVAGRLFTEDDREDTAAVAIVSQSFARRYWPDQDPLGRRFRTSADGPWLTVVGVAADVLHNWFLNQRRPTYYRPLAQESSPSLAFAIRTTGNPEALAGDLRRAIREADPNQPIDKLMTMDEVVADRTGGLSFIARALGVIALIAFALAMAGVYSLVAYIVSQRTKEIGVRVALGASWWQVIRLTTGVALKIAIAGAVAGTIMAIAVGRVMQSMLRGIVTSDPLTLTGLVLVIVAVALTAAFLPARRAANLEPTAALRTE